MLDDVCVAWSRVGLDPGPRCVIRDGVQLDRLPDSFPQPLAVGFTEALQRPAYGLNLGIGQRIGEALTRETGLGQHRESRRIRCVYAKEPRIAEPVTQYLPTAIRAERWM